MSLRLVFLVLILRAGIAFAHPVAQGAMEIVVHSDRVELRARVSVEEAFVAEGFGKEEPAENTEAIWQRHGGYLLKHIHVDADGTKLAGRILKIAPPPAAFTSAHISYDLEYALSAGIPPKRVTVTQDVLNEFEFAPGNPWEATFVVGISRAGGTAEVGSLFTSKTPVVFECDWTIVQSSAGEPRIDRWRMFREYIRHGIMHILTGYDHLLFMVGLVLAVSSLLDLVKVVTAFTLAHTVTLALSVLNIIRVPSHIVEPMIAASIVFVSAQNILFPAQSRGWTRLLVAFGFGLFHGLGFAGGLLEAMEGLPGLAIATAIFSFSIGVELGHQAVVLPLFAGLIAVRKNPVAMARFPVRRYASGVVCFAGMYYLVAALR